MTDAVADRGSATDTTDFLDDFDWANTTLGPVEAWPPALVSAANAVLPARVPMVIWWGPDFVQIYNDVMAELLGDKHPGAMGRPAADAWAEVWSELGPLAVDVLASGRPALRENQLLLIDRHGYLEETYWDFSFSPLVDETSETRGVFVAASDETARVVHLRRFRTVHELRLVSVTDAPDAVGVCREAMEVIRRNRAAVPFAGLYLPTETGETVELVASYGVSSSSDVVPDAVLIDETSAIGRVAQTGSEELVTGLRVIGGIHPSPLGPHAPDAAMLLPVVTAPGSWPVGVFVLGVNPYREVDEVYRTFIDVIAQQVSMLVSDAFAHQEERQRSQALIDLNEAKTHFFQNVSHEFRTPLTLIEAHLHDVLDDKALRLDGRRRADLESARRAAIGLAKMVDGLLELARADTQTVRPNPQPTDLSQLTRQLADMFRSTLEQAGVSLLLDVKQLDTLVVIDPDVWTTIVINLLSNAFKFTSRGSVQLRLAAVDDQIELTVTDTGVGISPADLPHVFDRLYQGQTRSARAGRGTGIGLSVVAELAAAHDGDVSAQSVLGQGSCFTVRMPLVRADDHERHDADGELLARATEWVRSQFSTVAESDRQRSEPAKPAPAQIGTLLLVEDHDDLRAYVVQLLEDDGWRVLAAPDAESALDALADPPDLILTDVMLPGMDGVELVQQVRCNAELARIPVLLLTAKAGPDAASEGLAAGADDYIVKPFDPRELIARVRVHHELSQLREYAISQAENTAANLRAALASNRQIGAAIGVLMALRGLTAEQAFDLLRTTSNRTNRKLRDLADEVVHTGTLDEA